MKATGIIRRIDDLGRVVIPKEIRRSMKLREGDPLELYIEDDKVIFRKYNTLDEIDTKKMWACVKAIFGETPFTIFDRDGEVVLTNSEGKKQDCMVSTSQDEFLVSAAVPEKMHTAVRIIETFLND